MLACLLTAAGSGCQTTGDPTQGGYWNWSEAKAIQRQDNLRGELTALNQESSRLQGEKASLQSELQRKRAQLSAARAKERRKITAADVHSSAQASTRKEISVLENEIGSLEAQLRRIDQRL